MKRYHNGFQKYDIQFDGSYMNEMIQADLIKVTTEFATQLANFMASLVGDAELTNTFKIDIVEDSAYTGWNGASGVLRILVGSTHWKSFIENYGMGSLMATRGENPFLDEYVQSEYFHEHRPANTKEITARRWGEYNTPDWDKGDGFISKRSEGRIPAGTNLETSYSWTTYKVRVRPKSPKFFMEHAFKVMRPILEDKLQDVINNFNYVDYWRLSR